MSSLKIFRNGIYYASREEFIDLIKKITIIQNIYRKKNETKVIKKVYYPINYDYNEQFQCIENMYNSIIS